MEILNPKSVFLMWKWMNIIEQVFLSIYFKATLNVSICDIMEKSIEISRYNREKTVDLHMSGSSLGTISRCLQVPHSSVQVITQNCKHHESVQLSNSLARRRLLCPRGECALVWNVSINSWTKAKDDVKKLVEVC